MSKKPWLDIPFNLPAEEAIKRIKTLFPSLQVVYADEISDLKEEWNGNADKISFKVRGHSLSGTLTVMYQHIELDVNLPFLARFYKKEIEDFKRVIRERAEELLA